MAQAAPKDLAQLESKLAALYARRSKAAFAAFSDKAQSATMAWTDSGTTPSPQPWRDVTSYWLDFAQRSVLFWDTLRQRGNGWLEHEKAGKPPLLHFKWDMVADARQYDPPVNYALVQIVPPDGVVTDPDKRPFVIIDPRAGHGPGIGGFKRDSEVGVALKAGHPVYFVIFFPNPEPGQTLADVSRVEAQFLRIIRERHPKTRKPVVIGNCQGGWAAMMLGALDPDLPGPIVVNGAPVSYWAGNDGENPMRYSGGMLGGAWPALFASDLGGGLFDGADLVQNFENLNPANTFIDKYYTLFSRVDTEPARFLEFERWWGGYFLMTRAEIAWIVDNLFIGNKLAAGEAEWSEGRAFDLRAIKSPIIVFASLGDNITPPQQALNWVSDLYATTEELKANGQVIVGLVHESIGHLGIFVSGSVAKREHSQIVRVLDFVEELAPGLYAMKIEDKRQPDGSLTYDVILTEHKVEDLRRIQTFDRRDEIPFEAVAAVSDVGQALYESFVHPWLSASIDPRMADLARFFHPLRVQRWALSDLNPFMGWLKPAAEAVKAARLTHDDTGPCARTERYGAALASAGLDLYRDLRDAATEQAFFRLYGGLSLLIPGLSGSAATGTSLAEQTRDTVAAAVARTEAGGLAEGVVRMAILLTQAGTGRRRLSSMARARDLLRARFKIAPLDPDTLRPLISEQALIVEAGPERALAALPTLISDAADRANVLQLVHQLQTGGFDCNEAQAKLLERFRALLGAPGPDSAKVVAIARARPRRAAS
jgi:pimeloyl-ACP methyl ester carboxylesterase